MMPSFDIAGDEGNPVVYALGRLPERTYIYKSFPARFGRDRGHPARYVCKVFDEHVSGGDAEDWAAWGRRSSIAGPCWVRW